VRPTERHVVELASGVRWERLTSHEHEDVDFLHVTYDVGGSSSPDSRLMRHQGREYGHVLTGRLGVQLGFEQHKLGPGDSIAFDSTIPHRLWNLGDEVVHGVWFVMGRSG
jgi:quercetin dioxygenase-like cupin family protein